MNPRKKRVCIICSLDRFANSVRPKKIKEFLEKNRYIVELINTYPNKVKSSSTIMIGKIRRFFIPRFLRNYLFVLDIKHRAIVLQKEIAKRQPDVLICESEMDSYVLTKPMSCLKIFDCSSPWVDELFYSGDLSNFAYKMLRRLELETYRKSDYVAFHWDNYTNYVKKYIYKGKNFFILNWGCSPREIKAKFKKPPRIVYLGKLDGYWNNIKLLSRLAKICEIDVYGAPEPPKELGLNYKGYAPTTDVLAEYQFGLVTLSNDRLRAHSFSSKQLEYMSYGLPVLTPEWRKDPRLEKYSILYNEKNFLQKIEEYSSKEKWQKISNMCFDKTKEWDWEKVLKPLAEIIESRFQ
jgi:hypothetical protein